MNEDIEDQAWAWHSALQGEDADWDGFTLWLEADPAHAQAYDAVALLDDTLDRQRERLAVILPAEEAQVPSVVRHRWGTWAGGAVAAALALFVAVPMFQGEAVDAADYRTGAGQTRNIALADGSHVTLGPASHLAVSGGDQGRMTLEGGAWFDIRHNPGRQLVITAGGQQISDIGTKFDVLALGGEVRVAVAEGVVSVGPQARQAIRVPAGKRISIDSANSAELADISAREVGGWRTGRLSYSDVPLSLVAADISRYVGRRVIVSPDMAGRRFSGVLAAGNKADLVDELGALMGLEAREQGGTVRLVAGGNR
jgi:transmembrane sensor